MTDAIRILSIDGGGIRGILPARLLQYIEQQTGHPARDLFHLIAGTSTGGIVGCGLLIGKPAKDLGDLYAQHGGEIFSHSLWHTVSTLDNLNGPKYDPVSLEQRLKEQLEPDGTERWLGDTSGVELLVPSYAIQLPEPVVVDGVPTTRQPFLFKTWKARGTRLDDGDKREQLDFRLADIARATSAAPTYFPPAYIRNRAGQAFGCVDGGVFANNPAMCALVAAHKLYPRMQERPVILVSLGTGSLERPVPYSDAKGWGELSWLHPILSILMDGNADTVCYQVEQVLGPEQHFRFEVSTGLDPALPYTVNEDFDCATRDNVDRLERLAERLIATQQPRLQQLIALLSTPRGDPYASG
jgi:patatin-like phospholipase/acyl hydrolase